MALSRFNISLFKDFIMPKPVVLFDLDGTVIDSTEAIVESFGVAFDHFGFAAPLPADIVSKIGHPLTAMFAKLGVNESKVDDFVARYKEHYRSVCNDKTVLLPNAKEAVDLMAKYATLGVVTTKTTRFSKEILDYLGVGEHFKTIIGFDEVKNPKPHPEPILLALKRLGDPKGKKWMIGDTPLDVIAAKEASVTPMAVLSGYATKEELLGYSCAIFDDVLKACEEIVASIDA